MWSTPARAARVRTVVLMLAGIVVGSLLSGPAIAHTGKKIAHLTKHLDPLYLNETQKAADANQLDGLDSTAFLRTTGKAADADKLDNIDSTGFLTATGKAVDADKLDNLDSAAFLQGATVYTRHFSCAGTTWNATFDNGHDVNGSLIYPDSSNSDLFRCNVVAPDGAIVTRVDFSVTDSDATDDIDGCAMHRTNMATSIGTEVQMAGTLVTTGATGDQRLSDTTITSATIDNASFSYFIGCGVEQTGTDGDVGIYGANVTYTITGTAGGG